MGTFAPKNGYAIFGHATIATNSIKLLDLYRFSVTVSHRETTVHASYVLYHLAQQT